MALAADEVLAAASKEEYVDLCHENPIVQRGGEGFRDLSHNLPAGFEGESGGIRRRKK